MYKKIKSHQWRKEFLGGSSGHREAAVSAGIACSQSLAEEFSRVFARLQTEIRDRKHIFLLIISINHFI